MKSLYYSITQRAFFKLVLNHLKHLEMDISGFLQKDILVFEKNILNDYKNLSENSNLSKENMMEIHNDMLERHIQYINAHPSIPKTEVYAAFNFMDNIFNKILKTIPPPGRVDYRLTGLTAERDIRRLREELLEKIWLTVIDAKFEADFLRYRCYSFFYDYIEDFPIDYESARFYLRTLTSYIKHEAFVELQDYVYIHPDDAHEILMELLPLLQENSVVPMKKLSR